ncbi:MAG: phosphotransferase [Clostridiales bacterium]|nr:phosphotransferase [Clostridiales bacterium]
MDVLREALYKEEKGNCLICLTGKLDTDSAEAWKADLTRIRKEHPEGRLILDVKDVPYVSSAGLRVFLFLGKQEAAEHANGSKFAKMWIRNVNDAVYDVLVLTGFIEMFVVSKPVRQISVKDLDVVGHGASGRIYRVDSDRIVKVFGDTYDYPELDDERIGARSALIRSIPTAIPFEIVQTEEGMGLVFELVNAKSVTQAILSDPEHLEDYMKRFCDLAHKVNSTDLDTIRFRSMKDMYKSRVLESAPYYADGDTEKIIKLIDNIPERHTMVHGDFHPGNVMIDDSGEMIIIDMFEVSYGHPMFDVMSMISITHSWTRYAPELATGYFSMSLDMLNDVFRNFVKYYFNGLSEQERLKYGDTLGFYSLIRGAVAPSLAKTMPEELKHMIAGGAVSLLRNEADRLLTDMDWGIFDSIKY